MPYIRDYLGITPERSSELLELLNVAIEISDNEAELLKTISLLPCSRLEAVYIVNMYWANKAEDIIFQVEAQITSAN